jgi:hypothetical protein
MKNESFFQYISRHQLVFFLSILVVSCGKGEKGKGVPSHTVSFEVLDTVAIPFQGKFTIHDIDPLSKTVLFVSHEGEPQIVLADFEGQTKSSFSTKEGLADGYGSLLAPLKIVGEDSILAYGSKGFLTFDYSGNLQSKVAHSKTNAPDGKKFSMGEGMEKQGKSYLFSHQGFVNLDQRGLDIRQKMRLLQWLDPKKGETESFLEFPESSIFRQGKFFFKDAWEPVFTMDDDLIYVVFGLEPVIYGFNSKPPYSLVSSTPVDLPEYHYFKGAESYSSELNFFDFSLSSGKILNIKRLEGHFVIAYFRGLDSNDSKELFDGKSTEEVVAAGRAMRKKFPTRIAIVDSLGNVVNDFVPEGLEPKSMLIRNGELWMMEKPDEEEERDYFRLFKVGLKIEK